MLQVSPVITHLHFKCDSIIPRQINITILAEKVRLVLVRKKWSFSLSFSYKAPKKVKLVSRNFSLKLKTHKVWYG